MPYVGINPKEFNRISATFNTVDDMKSYYNLTVGDIVRTLGYHSIGDGGGNDYEIVSSGTETEDDGSYIDLSSSGLQARGLFPNGISIKQFGAMGDGSNDDTSALQNAIDFADESKMMKVYVPYSDDGYIIKHNIELWAGVCLKGADSIFVPNLYPTDQANDMGEFVKGHTFVITSSEEGLDLDDNELIRMRDGTSVIGINFVHRDQIETNPPNEYPPVIRLQDQGGNGCTIRDCLFLNPYIGIDALGGHQNLNVIDVYMQPLKYGLRIDEGTQVDRIIRLDIGGFWHRRNWSDVDDDSNHVVYYMQEEGVGIEIGRSDNFQISQCLFFGIGRAILLNGSLGKAYGSVSDSSFDANDACIYSQNGISSNGILVSNCSIIPSSRLSSPDNTGFYVDEDSDDALLLISNCNSWGTYSRRFLVVLGGTVKVSNSSIRDWDDDEGCFVVVGGVLIMSSFEWADEGTSSNQYMAVQPQASFVLLNGCTWKGGSDSTFHVYDPDDIIIMNDSYGY